MNAVVIPMKDAELSARRERANDQRGGRTGAGAVELEPHRASHLIDVGAERKRLQSEAALQFPSLQVTATSVILPRYGC